MTKVVAYKGRSLLSRMIRFITGGPYSHVAIMFTEDMVVEVNGLEHHIAAGNVIEAWKGGVRLADSISDGHSLSTVVDIFGPVPELSRKEQETMAAFLMAQIGKKYDYWNVLRFLPLVRFFIPSAPDDIWNRSHIFCSSLVVEAFMQITRPLYQRCHSYDIRPVDLPRNRMLRYEQSMTTVKYSKIIY